MFSAIKLPILCKVFIIMICCVVTAGISSAFVNTLSKTASNKYFSSDENPAKRFLPSYKYLESLVGEPSFSNEKVATFNTVTKVLERIKTIAWYVDATLQLVLVSIFSLFFGKYNNARKEINLGSVFPTPKMSRYQFNCE